MADQQLEDRDRGTCPPRDTLLQWRQGDLPAEQIEDLNHHLESCAACQGAVEVLISQDPISRGLLRGPRPISEEDRAEVQGIVQRLRGLTPTPEPGAEPTKVRPHSPDFSFLDRPQADDEIGRLGLYRIRRLLGEGGMGQVFEAEDLRLQRPVAVKVMRPEAEQKPGAHERFLREARAAAAVRHEHVVTIYQVGEAKGVPFLVMELLEGQSLEMRCKKGPPLSLPEVVRIGREVAEGLAAAHVTGLTHRDIKPDNIFLVSGGVVSGPKASPPAAHHSPLTTHHPLKVKLLDFGLARAAAGDAHLTQSGMIVGTPAYMAPEQASGEPVDARTDLFALGCVLYRLASGRLPFQGKTPLAILHALANDTPPPLRQLKPEVPESFSRLVASLLARRPQDRPASARAVVEALATVEQECTARTRKRTPRLSLLSLAAGLFGLALAAGAVTVLRLHTEHGEIVIEAADPHVAVLFEQGKVQLHDRKSGKKYQVAVGAQQRPSGDYELEVTDEDAGLTFSTRELTLKRGQPVLVKASFVPKKAATPHEAVPADALKRQDIPEDLLAQAGGGDPAQAPPELVAVLGGPRYFPTPGPSYDHQQTSFSPDGRYLATCSMQQVWMYETATGRVLLRLPHDKQCGWLSFRPDNKALAVSWEDGIDLWEVPTGKSLGRLTGHAHVLRGLSYTPDGKSLVTCDDDGKARLWDVDRKAVVRTFDPPEGHRFNQAPQVHPDGRLVALHTSGPVREVRILDLTTGEAKATIPGTGPIPGTPGFESQLTFRFTPDGKLLAAVQGSRAVHLWDVATWKEVGAIEGNASLLAFSADSSTLLQGQLWNWSGSTLLLHDMKTRERKAVLELPIPGEGAWYDLSPDGRTVAVRAGLASSLRLFAVATGKDVFPAIGHQASVTAVAVSPDGRSVASTGGDHRVLLWDLTKLATGQGIAALSRSAAPRRSPALLDPHRERERPEMVRELAYSPESYRVMHGAAFSPDGKWVAAGMQGTVGPGWARLWDVSTGKEVGVLNGRGNEWQRTGFAFHPNGGTMITSEKNRLELRRLPDGAVSAAWDGGHEKSIEVVDFHPDGQRVASGDGTGLVCLHDVATGKVLGQMRCQGSVMVLRFSPDGTMLAATTEAPDAALYLWNLEKRVQTRLAGHTDRVAGLAWRPDGKRLATASQDRTVRLWFLDTTQPPKILQLNTTQCQLAFTPEGRHLLTANADGSIFVLRCVTKCD